MTAGVPGAGIAGLFYLATALLAPAWELLRAARGGRRSRWSGILRLAMLALGMIASMYAAGLIIGFALATPALVSRASGGWVTSPPASAQFIARATVLLTFGTLALVLAGVEVLRLVVRTGRPVARIAGRPAAVEPAARAVSTAGPEQRPR